MTDTSFLADNKSSSPQDNGKLLEDITKEIILKQTDRAEKFNQTSVRIYNIKNIEITPVHATGICDPSVHNINDVDKGTRTSATTITIPQLYNLVKTYNKSVMRYIRRLQQ